MINKFPDYEYKKLDDGAFHNMYHGIDLGFGGLVLATPGMYHGLIKTYDVSGMHPASIRALNLFGDEYTKIFGELVDLRLAIKHKDFDSAKKMLDGKAAPYLDDPGVAKSLTQALKIAVNSVYGLTSAKFDNPMRDIRNVNNIVALRGALFMAQLKEEVEAMGGQVIHIKTDSIKVVNPSPEVDAFIFKRGLDYGYTFEIEHVFSKICLVNNAVYIGKCHETDPEMPNQWTATGTQFAVPYVFKSLFSKEPIEFKDLCETKSVTSALYLDMNEGLPDVSEFEKEFKKYESDFKHGLLNDTMFEKLCQELEPDISKGHNYQFVGKVGEFCPIKPGFGGGELVREKDGKFSSATGAKGYRWLESETVRESFDTDIIDKSYYTKLVDEAVETISKFGSIEEFLD